MKTSVTKELGTKKYSDIMLYRTYPIIHDQTLHTHATTTMIRYRNWYITQNSSLPPSKANVHIPEIKFVLKATSLEMRLVSFPLSVNSRSVGKFAQTTVLHRDCGPQ